MANDNILNAKKVVDDLTASWDKHIKTLKESTEVLSKLNKEYGKVPSEYIKSVKALEAAERERLKTQREVIKNDKELEKLEQERLRTTQSNTKAEQKAQRQRLQDLKLYAKREKAFDRYEKQLANLNKKNSESTFQIKNAYDRLRQSLLNAEKKYKDLAASQGLSNKETIKAQKEVNKLRKRVDSINQPIGRFNDQVGNYAKGLRGIGNSFKSLIGAFGLTSGVYLFANAIRNTFNRLREFDKAMQNIAGIMRVSRSDIKDLEKEIRFVASTSIKTSREVAELAENLVTLGKTKSEIKSLLKPVNDLAIGLETSSAEAAEFLIQTLNAFGASSDEADRYADIIAGIRTSTSLDFQKMRDSFQYILPVSRLLNKDLEYTGALLGVVADSGIKAEQAGRLLASAQMRLSQSGKTLQDGLDDINNLIKSGASETEILAKATKVFGVNAAKVGATLALASQKVAQYEEKIRNSNGALKDLTETQLESLDAKLKILDSTWENFILGIENGDGVISNFIKGGLTTLTKMINALNVATKGISETERDSSFANMFEKLKKSSVTVKEAEKQLLNYRKAIKTTEKEVKEVEESLFSTYWDRAEAQRNLGFLRGQADAYREYIKVLKEAQKADNYDAEQKIIEGTVDYYEQLISANNKLIRQKKTINDLDEVRRLQRENKEYQKQIDLILNNTKKQTQLKKNNNDEIQRLLELYAMLEEAENNLFGKKKIETELSIEDIVDYNIGDLDLEVNERMLKALAGLTESTYEDMQKSFDKYLLENEGKYINDYEAFMEFTRLKKIDYEKMLEGLRNSTKKYLSNFSQDFINNSPLNGLIPFADGTFSKLIRGAEELDKKLGDKAGIISNKFAVSFNVIAESAQQAFNFIDSLSQQNFDAQFTRLEQKREYSIQFAGESATAREEIDRQYEARRRTIQQRQAEAQKDQAIFNVGIDTAQAIVATLAQTPPPKGLPLAALMASIGLAQLVAIKSKQIPQFWMGTEGTPGGTIMVNDDPFKLKGNNYKEVVQEPSGKLHFPQGKNVKMNVPKKSKVFPTYDQLPFFSTH